MAVFSSHVPDRRFGVADILMIAFVLALLVCILHLGAGMVAPFSPETQPVISTDPANLPYYAGRSLLRMFIAYGFSLFFTLVYGSVAAKNRTAGKILLPLLDILQSIPVLGFLAVTVTMFMGLFPHNLLGVELAAIFAIFTGQCWNMTFSFYHSLTTLPKNLQEAAAMLRLNWWQRFVRLEAPFAMIGLVWNSMMSFGGGWFFLAASEAITVLHTRVRLPGVGSYMAAAAEKGDAAAVLYAIAAMVVMIVLVDQLFWRPLVVWSQKFKMERTEAQEAPSSFIHALTQRSACAAWLRRCCLAPLGEAIYDGLSRAARAGGAAAAQLRRRRLFVALRRTAKIVGLSLVMLILAREAYAGVGMIAGIGPERLLSILQLGFYTLVRVIAATLLGVLWTVPVGVWIGLQPRFGKSCQTLVQIAASFPANMLYPFIATLYIRYAVNFEIGAVPFMMLGTQWYILFNVIAGSMAIPNDLKEAAATFKLTGRQKWRKLILPAIFPYLITGCITAFGGAWNASIVAELATWQSHRLAASGLGSFISAAAAAGDWPGILAGIVVMCAFVAAFNRLIWRRLYALAAGKYHLN